MLRGHPGEKAVKVAGHVAAANIAGKIPLWVPMILSKATAPPPSDKMAKKKALLRFPPPPPPRCIFRSKSLRRP